MLIANALSFFGNYSATDRSAAGKLPDCPIARPNREPAKPIHVVANTWEIAAMVQIPADRMYPFFVPRQSITCPIMMKQNAYATMTALLIIPYCSSLHPTVFCNSGAMIPRAERSM